MPFILISFIFNKLHKILEKYAKFMAHFHVLDASFLNRFELDFWDLEYAEERSQRSIDSLLSDLRAYWLYCACDDGI